MNKFRKKPVVIEAVRLKDPTSPKEVADWCGGKVMDRDCIKTWIEIDTLEGTMEASHGDWIIKGIKGEFYPCKHDIFEMTYEPVSEDEVDKCPICEGRKIMNQMYSLVDKIPLIGSSIFDDGTANIINELDDAKSTWCCMCLDKESEG